MTNPGDNGGIDPPAGAVTGTLRQAIVDANALMGASTITFDPMLVGTISLQADLDSLDKNITIKGNGNITVICAPGANVGFIFVVAGTMCEIDGLGIQNTRANSGSGIYNNGGSLTLDSCQISHCTSRGILNAGTLYMYTCLVEWNTGTGLFGGGIYNDGPLYCDSCTISFNSARNGGGIYNDSDGKVTLTDCSVSTNYASDYGGGIYNNYGTVVVSGPMGPGGPGLMMSTDLSYNTAVDGGGGLYQTGSGASTTFTGASITENQVSGPGGKGGGVCINGGFVQFTYYCWIDDNSATLGEALAYKNPGGSFSIDDSCTVYGTIAYYQ